MALTAVGNSFVFIAVKAGGGRTLGVRWARSRAALAELLRKDRLLLLSAWPLPEWAGTAPVDRPLRLGESAILNEQLAQLLARGVPLTEALEVASETIGGSTARKIARIREQVASGVSFAEACRAVGGFDVTTLAVYRAAERSGELAGAAGQLAATARRGLLVAGKAITLLIYPAIVVIVSVLVALLLLSVIVPMFGQQLLESGINLPRYTRGMISLGFWLQTNWMWIVLGLFALAITLVIQRARLAALAARAARTLPLIRGVVLAQESARFFSTMAAMTRSGVPLADALAASNQAIGHPRLRSQMERMRTRLVEGAALRSLIDEVDALPLATRRLLIAAERAGDMEQAFGSLAGDMTDEVDKRSQRLLALLQPALIIAMFIVIGGLVSSIMIPMLTLSANAR